MTKRQYIELIRTKALGYDQVGADYTEQLHPLIVEKDMAAIYSDAIFAMIKDSPRDIDSYSKIYSNISIQYNSDEDYYYADLPIPIMQLPRGGGLVKVWPTGNRRSQFEATDTVCLENYFDIDEIAGVYDRGSYTLEGLQKIILAHHGIISKFITSVSARIVVPFEQIGMDDEITIPSGRETDFKDIITQMLYKRVKEPTVIDNN